MGREAACTARWGGQTGEGKAHLDTDSVWFRGAFRFNAPYAELSGVRESGGTLCLEWPGGPAELDLGVEAARWAERIRNPKSRLEKLGVRAGMRVAVVGLDDPSFHAELQAVLGAVDALVMPSEASPADVIFLGVEEPEAMEQLPSLLPCLQRDGMLWAIRRRGAPGVTEAGVMAAGKAAGLALVKTARFSESQTGEKFVIPKAAR